MTLGCLQGHHLSIVTIGGRIWLWWPLGEIWISHLGTSGHLGASTAWPELFLGDDLKWPLGDLGNIWWKTASNPFKSSWDQRSLNIQWSPRRQRSSPTKCYSKGHQCRQSQRSPEFSKVITPKCTPKVIKRLHISNYHQRSSHLNDPEVTKNMTFVGRTCLQYAAITNRSTRVRKVSNPPTNEHTTRNTIKAFVGRAKTQDFPW